MPPSSAISGGPLSAHVLLALHARLPGRSHLWLGLSPGWTVWLLALAHAPPFGPVPLHAERLQDQLGLENDSMVLDFLLRKIITNLRIWTDNRPIIEQSLKLLTALCQSFNIVRRLLELTHTAADFPFLDRSVHPSLCAAGALANLERLLRLLRDCRILPCRPEHSLPRTTYCSALGRLLGTGEDQKAFEQVLSIRL